MSTPEDPTPDPAAQPPEPPQPTWEVQPPAGYPPQPGYPPQAPEGYPQGYAGGYPQPVPPPAPSNTGKIVGITCGSLAALFFIAVAAGFIVIIGPCFGLFGGY